jgi:hypothetical protein
MLSGEKNLSQKTLLKAVSPKVSTPNNTILVFPQVPGIMLKFPESFQDRLRRKF